MSWTRSGGQRTSTNTRLVAFAVLVTCLGHGLPSRADQPLLGSGGSWWDEADTWEFQPGPDAFTDEALLDLRGLNERHSGQSGFVGLSEDGNSFVDGGGRPLRFWAVGSEIYRRSPEEVDRHCRFLAKRGVNLVRLHLTVADTSEGADLFDVKEGVIAQTHRFIKAAKENGIYVVISPYYAHHKTPRSWRLPGYSESGEMPWGTIFVDQRMQAAYREWTRRFYTAINPHTGLAIAEDPTVAVIQVQNEDSLLFWTADRMPEALKAELRSRFARWLIDHYGALSDAFAAWEGVGLPLDDAEAGVVELYSLYHLTIADDGGKATRVRDQRRFLAELQRDFYASMGRHLREDLGCRQLLNATNWKTADKTRLKPIERWTYEALEVDAQNAYYGGPQQHLGENNGYRIDPGHFLRNESCLGKPWELPINFPQTEGHPLIVTETSWKRPNLYQSEGPFLVSAYQSLGGVDAVFWFTATASTWEIDCRRMFWKVGDSHALNKWTCSTPMLMGMFPAAALAYRRADLEEGPVVALQRRGEEALFAGALPSIGGAVSFDENRDVGHEDRAGSPPGPDVPTSGKDFLRGRVVAVPDGGKAPDRSVREDTRPTGVSPAAVSSATGQLSWDADSGICTIDSARTQGVAGFLRTAGGEFPLSGVTIQSENEYACVWVTSLDDMPLTQSGRVLVQVGTAERPAGWKTTPAVREHKGKAYDGAEIVHAGGGELRIGCTRVKLSIQNPRLRELVTLDPNGYARERQPLAIKGDEVSAMLPSDAMYYVLSTGRASVRED